MYQVLGGLNVEGFMVSSLGRSRILRGVRPAWRKVVCLLAMALVGACASLNAYAVERITRFASDIVVQPSGNMIVTETLDVLSHGYHIRHGLYRDFPVINRISGVVHRVGFDVISARLDGEPVQTRQVRKGDYVRLYLGSPNVNIAPGPHRFVLRYRTNRQIRFFKMHDELYWNVTGNRWKFPIEQAVSTVHFPDGAGVEGVKTYTGSYGQQIGRASCRERV